MKKILLGLVLLACITTSTVFADTNSNKFPSVTLSSVVANKYLAFGSGGMIYDRPVLQSDLLISFQNGFYADVWNSSPFERYDHNYGTEQDFGIGWSGPLSTFGVKNKMSDLNLDIGITYFDEPHVLTLGSDDIIYSHVKVSKMIYGVTLYGSYENYMSMPGSSCPGGNLYGVGINKKMSFFGDKLNASASIGPSYDSGGFGLDNGFLIHGEAELDWKLSEHMSLILPQVRYYIPITVNDSRRSFDEVIAGGLSYKF